MPAPVKKYPTISDSPSKAETSEATLFWNVNEQRWLNWQLRVLDKINSFSESPDYNTRMNAIQASYGLDSLNKYRDELRSSWEKNPFDPKQTAILEQYRKGINDRLGMIHEPFEAMPVTETQPAEMQAGGQVAPYVTALTPGQESSFQQWIKTNKIPWIDEPKADYDMRGFWKAQQAGDPRAVRGKSGHFPDTWKTPYHSTFSNESIYATPLAPHWKGEALVPWFMQEGGQVPSDALAKTTAESAQLAASAMAAPPTPQAYSEEEMQAFPWLRPKPKPEKPTIDEATFKAAVDDALKATEPKGPLEPLAWAVRSLAQQQVQAVTDPDKALFEETPLVGPLSIAGAGVVAKEVGKGIAAIPSFAAHTGAALMSLQEAENLQGMSMDQVRAKRAEMQQRLAEENRALDGEMRIGSPDSSQLFVLSQRVNSLEQRIKEADGILARGVPSTVPSPMTQPVGAALRSFGQWYSPEVARRLDQVFPTNQDYENSFVGQVEKNGAQGIVLGAAGLMLGPIGTYATASALFGDQAYQEAIRAGATPETAERVSLVTGVLTGATSAITGPAINALAKSFAGMTAKEGIKALVRMTGAPTTRIVGGGFEMAIYGVENDAIAKLSGYDPNRKLGSTFWQNFWAGNIYGGMHALAGEHPRLASLSNPDVKVRSQQPFAAMPGEAGFVIPQEGRPPMFTGVPKPTVSEEELKTDTRSATDKLKDLASSIRGEVPTAPPAARGLMLGAPPAPPAAAVEAAPPAVTPEVTPETAGAHDQILAAHRAGRINDDQLTWLSEVAHDHPEEALSDLEKHQRGEVTVPTTTELVRQGEVTTAAAAPAAAPTAAAAPAAVAAPAAAPLTPFKLLGRPLTTAEGDRLKQIRQEIVNTLPAETRAAIERLDPEAHSALENEVNRRFAQEQAAPAAPTAPAPTAPTPRATGYRVNWEDHTYSEQDAARYRSKIFRTKKEVQQHLSDLKRGPNTGIKTEPLYEPKAWYELPVEPLRGYTQQDLTAARQAAEQSFRDQDRDPNTVPRSEWVDQMREHLENPRPSEEDLALERQASDDVFNTPAGYKLTVGVLMGDEQAGVELHEMERTRLAELVAQRRQSRGRGIARELPPDRAVTPDDVKRETITAQDHMGMHDNLVYTPTVDDLPKHVLEGMTPQERASAQIVTDRKLGNVHVIGDRFRSLNELRRAIIEETIPYRYRNVSNVQMEHNPASNDYGTYDHIADRPVLNTHALLRAPEPYREALRSVMEEVDAHQGIGRLLGPREGTRYVGGMADVQGQFDRMGWNDMLARLKGYDDLESMAQAYLGKAYTPNWRKDPRLQNKMTEELIGAYSRTFKTPEELAANAPQWYTLTLRNMADGIRRFLGIRVDPYDVQSLISDSAAALRTPKWAEPSRFHPIGDAAKADMQAFQYANRAPEEAGAGGPQIDIGREIVEQYARELERGLTPGQFIRAQPLKMAFDSTRDLHVRLDLLRKTVAVDNRLSDQELHDQANRVFVEDFNNNVHVALDSLISNGKNEPVAPILTETTSRKAQAEIKSLRAEGNDHAADLLQARVDRMEQVNAPDVTDLARTLRAQRFRNMHGDYLAGEAKKDIQQEQTNKLRKLKNRKVRDQIDGAKTGVDAVTADAAQKLVSDEGFKQVADAINKKTGGRWTTTKPLGAQYSDDLVERLKEAFTQANSTEAVRNTPGEPQSLAQIYDNFRKNIESSLREQFPREPRTITPPDPMDTLRDVMKNYLDPYYREAWARTVEGLQSTDPQLYGRLDAALDIPVGEKLANKLALSHGQNLRDLIYMHYSNSDRVGQDLGTKIALATGMDDLLTRQLANHLQERFSDIIRTEQADRLQQILNSVGRTPKKPKGELDRLLDQIALGALDSAEWRNTVASRFGLRSYDDELLDNLRFAGNEMLKLRDSGNENTFLAQKFRYQMGDVMRLNGQGRAEKWWRYAIDTYVTGMLNGLTTHLPYWQQALFTQQWDAFVDGIRALAHAHSVEDAGYLGAGMIANWFKGVAGRGFQEFGPILRRSIKPEEAFMGEPGPMAHGALDLMQVRWQDPRTWWGNFKYIRNFLDATANLMLRGAFPAISHAVEMAAVWDKGMTGKDAYEAARQAVWGTADEQARATREAADLIDSVPKETFKSEGERQDYQKMVEGQILDRIRTSDDADDMLGATENARDRQKRAFEAAMVGTLRGNVRGALGYGSTALLNLTRRRPGAKIVAPFIKVPLNGINQYMAWSPLGVTRALNIENYMAGDPAFESKVKRGEITEPMIRAEAARQMSRGIVGTTVFTILGAIIRGYAGSSNPPFRITYSGAPTKGEQDTERGKGWQEKSWRIGDGAWHSYENTPWRVLLATLGGIQDHYFYQKDKGGPFDATEDLKAGVAGVQAGLSSGLGSPLQGIDTAMNFVSNFTGATDNASRIRAIGNFLTSSAGQLATEIIPSPVMSGTQLRQVYRMFDPTVYEGKEWWQKFLRYIPVVNHMTLQPELNVFGQHIVSSPFKGFPQYSPTGGFFGTGIGRITDPNDPVWNWLDKHPDIHLTMPGNSASVGGYKMTPEEIRVYHLARGPALYQEFQTLINDPEFNSMKPAEQNKLILRVYEHAANLEGARAVEDYRDKHPITPERERQRLLSKGLEPEVETAGTVPTQ